MLKCRSDAPSNTRDFQNITYVFMFSVPPPWYSCATPTITLLNILFDEIVTYKHVTSEERNVRFGLSKKIDFGKQFVLFLQDMGVKWLVTL